MEPFKNIVLAICLTINFGIRDNRLSVKPSAYLMPEKIFTNQANIELVKKTKVNRINPPCISLYRGGYSKISGKGFQLRIPLPDLAAVFIKGRRGMNNEKMEIGKWKLEKRFLVRSDIHSLSEDELAYRTGW